MNWNWNLKRECPFSSLCFILPEFTTYIVISSLLQFWNIVVLHRSKGEVHAPFIALKKTKHKTNQKSPFLCEADWEDGWGRMFGWGEVRKHLPPSSNVCLLGLRAAARTAETRGLCVGRWCFSSAYTHTHTHVRTHRHTAAGFSAPMFLLPTGKLCYQKTKHGGNFVRPSANGGRYRHALNNVINYTENKTKHLIYRQWTQHHSLWKSPVKIMKYRNKWNEMKLK